MEITKNNSDKAAAVNDSTDWNMPDVHMNSGQAISAVRLSLPETAESDLWTHFFFPGGEGTQLTLCWQLL